MIKMYLKEVFLTMLSLLLVSGAVQAQTTHNIPNTKPDTLRSFILTGEWAAGDIINLTSAGVYDVSATVDLPRSVTIQGAPALASRPVIRFTGSSGSFRAAVNNLNLTFKDVDFNGYQANGTSRTPYIFRGIATAVTDPAGGLATSFTKLAFENSKAWGFQGGIILNNNALRVLADEVVLNNVDWSDMVGAYAINLNQNGVKSLRVVNSTFSNIANGFINNPYFSAPTANPPRTEVIPQSIVIENNTFYRVSGAGGNTFIQINDPKDASVTFTFRNNVVSTLHTADNSRPFRIDPLAGNFTFDNNLFHNFTSTREEGIYNISAVDAAQTNVTVNNPATGEPGFANAAINDFRIPAGSALLTASTTGGAIGDPSWTSGGAGFRTHLITNAEENSLKTFIENTALWSPGDVIMLTSAGNYKETGYIRISQDLTVMGDPALATRPTVTFHGGGFMPVADNLSMTFKGFDVNGKTRNAEGNEQRAMILEYGRDNAFGAKMIRFEDMTASGLKSGVELYYNSLKTYDNIVIDNVIWHDITDWVFNPRINAIKDVKITNSTFYNAGGFIFNPYFSRADRPTFIQQNILVDRNTFYNIGDSNRGLFQINDSRDGSVNLTFTNNIVSKIKDPGNSRPFNLHPDAGKFTLRNNIIHDFDATVESKKAFNIDVILQLPTVSASNNTFVSPGFADASTGNFRLPAGSAALTASMTGGPVGDPTWATGGGFKVHQVTNAEENSLKTFIENTALWSPGDVIMLTSAGNYKETGYIRISQDLTVMGDPALATRPTVTFHTGGFMPVADNLSMTFKGFDVNGKTESAAGTEQRAMILEYGRDNAFGAKLIKFEDMTASGLKSGVELYYNSLKTYDNIVINNVEWSDITDWVFNPRINAIKDVKITNSTFYNAGGFIFNPYFSRADRPTFIQQNILVDRNTFYNIGDSNRGLFQINDSRDGSVNLTFTNNIVSKIKDPGNSRPFNLHAEAGRYTFRNNVIHDFDATVESKMVFNFSVIKDLPVMTQANNLTDVNPGFLNVAEGNFKLPNGSPLATAGTTGGLIGDPQWAPDNVTSARRDLAAAKVEVYPNPVHDMLYINAQAAVEVVIYNMNGTAVWRGTINKTGSIDIAGIKSGLYIARINSGSAVQTVKILKQ